MQNIHHTKLSSPTAILVAVATEYQPLPLTLEYLTELKELAQTAGFIVEEKFIQSLKNPLNSTFIGKGKLEEVKTFIESNNIHAVIFDDDLSPSQLKNIEQTFNCEILDRSLLILNIFSMRAQTAQAKTQVELAKYQYLYPKLTKMWSHLSRQRGGGGTGMQGTGEKELETDRRIVQKKITLLKEKLSQIEKQTATQRKRRKKLVRVALVGYTNAGKSTLMQKLSKSEAYAEDKLFATLATTVRKVVLNQTPFLLSDTVGFIRKLPHTLIECFKSTLAEAQEADLLLHVVDISNPSHFDHIQVVKNTLKEIKADHIPIILIANKIDNLIPSEVLKIVQEKISNIKIIASEKSSDEMDFLKYLTLEIEEITWEKVQQFYESFYQVPTQFISAEKKIKLNELREIIYKNIHTRHLEIYPNYLEEELP